jgi:LPS O-antigen subunit length determinant protein (WzzB/FepE family)
MEPVQSQTLVPPRDAVFAYYPVEVPPRDDEIRLVDLWRVLVRRKAVFFVVAGLLLAAGLGYALLAPPKYRYSALIELGWIPTPAGLKTVEGVQTALTKVNEAFLPAALADYLETQPAGTRPPKVRASIPKGSETLMLDAEGPVDKGPTLVGIQQAVIARLSQHHAAFVDAERRSIGITITATRNKLEALAAAGTALQNQSKRTEELAASLREQRGEVQADLDAAIALEQDLLSDPAATRDTAALLQANIESRALRDQLLALDERLAVNLPKQLEDLRAAIETNNREILAQQEGIAGLEARLSGVLDTRAIQPPTQSLEKAGPGRTVIVLLAGMLGLFLGLLAAFGAEFVSRMRAEMAGDGPGAMPDE